MKVLIQRVSHASVTVANRVVGNINHGLLLFVGIEKQDSLESLKKMAKRVCAYRLFSDQQGKMNLSVQDIKASILAVSQFTLVADTQKGLRPSFSRGAAPDQAKHYFDQFVMALSEHIEHVETGEFGADMQVILTNDGPVTFMLSDH